MYTHEIKSSNNGKTVVLFSYDTGEIEEYTEQITVSEAQFATESTPFIPPVFEIVKHYKPKLLQVECVFDDRQLESDVTLKKSELDAALNVSDRIETAEEIAAQAAAAERMVWLDSWHKYLRAKKAIEALREADITPSQEEETAFAALKQWVADNRKIEYVEYM